MRAFQRHSGKELASLCAAAVPSLETNAGDLSEADIPRILSPAEQYHRDNDARALRRQMDFPDTQEREARRNGHG
jgi:hypothetical protein